MGDRENDTVDDNIDENEENVSDEEISDDEKDEKDEDETEEEGGDGADDDEKDDSGEESTKDDEKDEKDEKDEEDEDLDPPTRRGKTNWRKNFFSEKHKEEKKVDKETEDDDDDEEDNDIAPEDEAMVDKVIRKRYGSKFDQLDEKADEGEVKDFVADNPQFKPYKSKILKYLKHPSRSHLPVKTIALEVAGDDLMKLGAKKGKQADLKAKKKAGGGHSPSSAGGSGKSTSDMSDKEFDAEVERVKHSKRD